MNDNDIVIVGALSVNDKLPKNVIVHDPTEARKNGITRLKYTATLTSINERYVDLKITGEYNVRTSKYRLMMLLVYNENDELISADFSKKIDKDSSGSKSFSIKIEVPKDESISRISIRFIPDPVHI